ncbi:phytanoyl-CoA dioxygenase family protein [Longirhabdus pacifica]|uniref:phytanoyl-CoA dioxygenase family protein n=1 Tax=Longirhabdus pacifica TaxID=2305227 RepID=UPI001008C7D0|nr:phytanoyl-CoA dioxygenase family protein [Longirhabdus pacifica]
MRFLNNDEMTHLREQGYVVVPKLYASHEIEKLKETLHHEWLDLIRTKVLVQRHNKPLISIFETVRDRHMHHDQLKNTMLDERHFHLIEQILGEEALAIGTDTFYKPPGASALPYHQDNYDIGVQPGTTWAIWISIDEAKKENGCLRFVPNTQHFDLIPPRLPAHITTYGQAVRVPAGYQEVDVPTNPGDVVIFNGHVLHGSHANQTSYAFRRAFAIHYTGVSVEKIFVHYLNLYNKKGEVIQRKLNKRHKLQFEQQYLSERKNRKNKPMK